MIFLYQDYEKFCAKLAQNNIYSIRADEAFNKEQFFILKHDVEANPKKALDLAKIEYKYGHKAVYYFQPFLFSSKELKEIIKLGHEVSYHYDVLDANKGDFKKAKDDFDKDLKKLNNMNIKIKTICQHGNPLIKRNGYNSNRDFFKKYKNNYKTIVDIMVNFRDKVKDKNYLYISDAGYSLNIIYEPENSDQQEKKKQLKSFDNIIELAKNNSIIFSSHPHRYFSNYLQAQLKFKIFTNLKKLANVLSKNRILKNIISRFYFLAKRF